LDGQLRRLLRRGGGQRFSGLDRQTNNNAGASSGVVPCTCKRWRLITAKVTVTESGFARYMMSASAFRITSVSGTLGETPKSLRSIPSLTTGRASIDASVTPSSVDSALFRRETSEAWNALPRHVSASLPAATKTPARETAIHGTCENHGCGKIASPGGVSVRGNGCQHAVRKLLEDFRFRDSGDSERRRRRRRRRRGRRRRPRRRRGRRRRGRRSGPGEHVAR
jgi:hypothetical protein